jgi:hypothetical protein
MWVHTPVRWIAVLGLDRRLVKSGLPPPDCVYKLSNSAQPHDEDIFMFRRHKPSTAAASILSGAILSAVLFFSAAPRLHAEDIDRCQRRVAHADHELHEAIEKHGRNSRQANHERRELHSAREHCWSERHRWWDEHEHRWHTERDWNEHDHD